MNVIAFAPRSLQQDGTWQASELSAMQSTFAAELANGEASGWHAAATEVGDPQFYLLGPPPDEDCILAISRIGRLYILEDGAGQVVYEHINLERLTEQAKAFLRGTQGLDGRPDRAAVGGGPAHIRGEDRADSRRERGIAASRGAAARSHRLTGPISTSRQRADARHWRATTRLWYARPLHFG